MTFLSRKITAFELKILKFFVPIIFSIFLGLGAYSMLRPSRYLPLKFGSEIDMTVIKLGHYKGQVILNDSIILFYNCPEVILMNHKAPYRYKLENVRKFKIGANDLPPFRILKEKNTEIFMVIDLGDTTYHKLNGAKDTLTLVRRIQNLFIE